METFRNEDLDALLEVNKLRASGAHAQLLEPELKFSSRFRANHKLAVYGSLAPGRSNHSQLQDIRGTWYSGLSVTGELRHQGWGSDIGYPGFRWSESGNEIPVQLFVSDELPEHWSRLDDFEGPEYLRVLVPVKSAGIITTVANLYALR